MRENERLCDLPTKRELDREVDQSTPDRSDEDGEREGGE